VRRAKLFKQINTYPTLFEVVTGRGTGGTRNSSKPAGISNAGKSTLPAKRKEPSSVSYWGRGSAAALRIEANFIGWFASSVCVCYP
jgi:hypothetical protein